MNVLCRPWRFLLVSAVLIGRLPALNTRENVVPIRPIHSM